MTVMNVDKTLACDPAKLMEPGYIRAPYAITVGPEVKLTDVLSPKYWRVCRNLKVNDKIEVIGENFDISLRVVVASDSLVCVRKIPWEAGPAEQAAKAAAPKSKAGGVRFIPGKKRWCAYAADGAEVSSGHANRLEAEKALEAA
jgi:hypothetical protein